MNLTKYIQEADKEALKSDFEYRMGAVIVRGGRVIARGYNRMSALQERASRMYGVEFFSLHAEINALLDCNNVKGATMFVSGVKQNGNLINCKPCKKCAKILRHIGIPVYYSDKGKIHKL